MNHQLNPEFHYLANRATGKAYVVARAGQASIVNLDAMELIAAADPQWQSDPDYAAFLAQCVEAGWLVVAPVGSPLSTARPSVRWIDRATHLRRLQYEVNLVCNLECAHCYCSSSPSASAGRSTAFVREVIRQAAELGVIYFDFTGGEPMVRSDLVELVTTTSHHGMVPSLFSNCTLMTPARARELQLAGLSSVQTSLDARTPELHDAIRGKAGAFERTVRGIRALQELGLPVSVSVCLNRRNAHELAAIVELLQDELAVPFRLDRVIPAGRGCAHDQPLALENHEYYELIRRQFGEVDAPLVKVCDSPNLAAADSAIEPHCGVGASYLFLKHDGRAALCPTLTEAESPDFAQANLDQMSLAEAWERHPTFMAFRGMQCENVPACPAAATCRGGCRSNAYLLHGRVDSPDEACCNMYKNDSPHYRPFLAEYEMARGAAPAPAARRRLRVVA